MLSSDAKERGDNRRWSLPEALQFIGNWRIIKRSRVRLQARSIDSIWKCDVNEARVTRGWRSLTCFGGNSKWRPANCLLRQVIDVWIDSQHGIDIHKPKHCTHTYDPLDTKFTNYSTLFAQ